MKESAAIEQLRESLTAYDPDAVFWKMEPGRGIPDLYMCSKGRSVWVEIKIKGNFLSPLQLNRCHKLTVCEAPIVIAIMSKELQCWILRIQKWRKERAKDEVHEIRRHRGEKWPMEVFFE